MLLTEGHFHYCFYCAVSLTSWTCENFSDCEAISVNDLRPPREFLFWAYALHSDRQTRCVLQLPAWRFLLVTHLSASTSTTHLLVILFCDMWKTFLLATTCHLQLNIYSIWQSSAFFDHTLHGQSSSLQHNSYVSSIQELHIQAFRRFVDLLNHVSFCKHRFIEQYLDRSVAYSHRSSKCSYRVYWHYPRKTSFDDSTWFWLSLKTAAIPDLSWQKLFAFDYYCSDSVYLTAF